jgi:hypothetical protein
VSSSQSVVEDGGDPFEEARTWEVNRDLRESTIVILILLFNLSTSVDF